MRRRHREREVRMSAFLDSLDEEGDQDRTLVEDADEMQDVTLT